MARDTKEDWKQIGLTEPWYGVLSAPEFMKANLTEETKERFYAQGREEIAWAVDHIRSIHPEFSPAGALDFGCGLGRHSFAMREYCAKVTGCDISPGMLKEATNQRNKRNISGVTFVEGFPGDQKFDWVNTYIVLQHIPPRVGYLEIGKMLEVLKQGGCTSIQLTFAHDQRDQVTIQRDAAAYRYDGETTTLLEYRDRAAGDMSMYDYDLNRVLFMFVRSGIGSIKLVHTDHGGCHGFWVFGRKGA